MESKEIVCDYLSYLSKKIGVNWKGPIRYKPTQSCLVVRALCDNFESSYGELLRVKIIPSIMRKTTFASSSYLTLNSSPYQKFINITNFLFLSEGDLKITWSRIIALLITAGALATPPTENIVLQFEIPRLRRCAKAIYKWTIDFFDKHHLSEWIDLHGGWSSIAIDPKEIFKAFDST
jgi:hypothetical protein